VDVAKLIPEIVFEVVGIANRESSYTRTVLDQLEALPNVVIHGRVRRERMSEVYRNAHCLLCTSALEGFPNTFLEAWSQGVPVVSTFDPDGLIAYRGLGFTTNDVPGLVNGLRMILHSSQNWRQASENARRYYVENHAVHVVMPRFERHFLAVMGRSPRIVEGACL
jgi:glycosyltransferase involved in cell wall biosynthesis